MGNTIFYAFPPFSFIAHCLHKIARVEAEGIMIVPLGLSSDIQPYTAGAPDTKCAKGTATDRDHAQNAREIKEFRQLIKRRCS